MTQIRGGGVKCWYIRRYRRVLVPYFIIAGIGNILAVMRGRTIAEAVLNISTISYWLEHKGAWYIAMLIPLYAITPVHDAICKKIKNPVYYTLVIVIIIVGISSLHFECPNVGLAQFIENVRHVLVHLPAFVIGFMLAPMAKEEKCISFLWMIVVPLFLVIMMKYLHFGYWPGFLVFSFVPLLCRLFCYSGKTFMNILSFFGKISLESYLFNGIVGSWIIVYLPWIYESPVNKGCYLHYALVIIVGTALAYWVNRFCEKALKKN